MNTCEHSNADHLRSAALFLLAAEPESHEPVEVTKTPGNETETSDTEESVEDLRVNLEPDSTRRVNVVAAIEIVCRSILRAHFGCGATKKQEQHAAPCYDVETVDCDEEAERCAKPFPECFETNGGRFHPGLFRWFNVAVGILRYISRLFASTAKSITSPCSSFTNSCFMLVLGLFLPVSPVSMRIALSCCVLCEPLLPPNAVSKPANGSLCPLLLYEFGSSVRVAKAAGCLSGSSTISCVSPLRPVLLLLGGPTLGPPEPVRPPTLGRRPSEALLLRRSCRWVVSSHPPWPKEPLRISPSVGALDVASAVAAHIPSGGSEFMMLFVVERIDRFALTMEELVAARARRGLGVVGSDMVAWVY